eukprot:scaffold87917_cov42-Phaeocystis_antarctica.AAC.1
MKTSASPHATRTPPKPLAPKARAPPQRFLLPAAVEIHVVLCQAEKGPLRLVVSGGLLAATHGTRRMLRAALEMVSGKKPYLRERETVLLVNEAI